MISFMYDELISRESIRIIEDLPDQTYVRLYERG